jgi:hypothetical protein
MGFNKRMISKELIVSTDEQNIPKLFDADSLIFDNWSYKFYELFLKEPNKQKVMELLS